MSMTDPIADLLTRIRNAQMVRHRVVPVPASKMKESIARILQREGYVERVERVEQHPQDTLHIRLKYDAQRRGAIEGLQRESSPGRRVYVSADELPRVRDGLGVAIISTSSGILADHEARDKRVGGEFLCSIW